MLYPQGPTPLGQHESHVAVVVFILASRMRHTPSQAAQPCIMTADAAARVGHEEAQGVSRAPSSHAAGRISSEQPHHSSSRPAVSRSTAATDASAQPRRGRRCAVHSRAALCSMLRAVHVDPCAERHFPLV